MRISVFRNGVAEDFFLLGCDAACVGGRFPAFRGSFLSSFSRVEIP